MTNSTNTTCIIYNLYIHPGLSSIFLMIRCLDILFSFLYVTVETNLSIGSRRSQGRMDGSRWSKHALAFIVIVFYQKASTRCYKASRISPTPSYHHASKRSMCIWPNNWFQKNHAQPLGFGLVLMFSHPKKKNIDIQSYIKK